MLTYEYNIYRSERNRLLDTSGSIGDHMIDDNDARVLKGHQNVICIWCYASEDARYNKLQGFYTGMFLL
ncbi:MAG: hypothetical protein ACI3Y6_09395 [Candidatus Cryptobacteroides sp.]